MALNRHAWLLGRMSSQLDFDVKHETYERLVLLRDTIMQPESDLYWEVFDCERNLPEGDRRSRAWRLVIGVLLIVNREFSGKSIGVAAPFANLPWHPEEQGDEVGRSWLTLSDAGSRAEIFPTAEVLETLEHAIEVIESGPAASGSHAIQADPPKRGMPWEVARNKAEAIVKSNGFPRTKNKPSLRKLADLVGCSPGTVKNAVLDSKRLSDAYLEASPVDNPLAALIREQWADDKSRYA